MSVLDRLFRYRFNTYLFFLLPQLILFTLPYELVDLGLWIGLGREILTSGSIVTSDKFSVLQTAPMVYPSWGLSVVYALLDKLGGIELIYCFHRAIFLLFQLLIYKRLGENQLSDRFKFIFVLMSVIGASLYIDRTAMFGMLYLFAIHRLLETKLMTMKSLVLIYLTIVFWANTHGSVLFAYVYLAFFALYQFSQRVAMSQTIKWALSSFVVIFLGTISNPFTIDIYPYAIETAKLSQARMLSEWASPTLPKGDHVLEVIIFYILGLFDVFKRVRADGFKALIHPVSLTFFFGMTAVRHIVWFFWTYLLWHENSDLRDSSENQMNLKEQSFLVLLMLFLLLLIPPMRTMSHDWISNQFQMRSELYSENSPVHAVDMILREGRSGVVFNQFEFGGYLIYRLDGTHKIFLDGRNIIYSNQDFQNYRKVFKEEAFYQSYFRTYDVTYVLIHADEHTLVSWLRSNLEYREIYSDSLHVLFRRKY